MEKKENIKQEQIHKILFNKELGWQDIIYDLINTEQLDPWDIDIIILSDKYLEKINKHENDFFVSSKVLLAASLLLRIKSEILLNRYIKSIDEILFGKKEQKKAKIERIELEDEIPELIPRSPMPRFRKVTLNELMESLNKAITTENRRIKKEIINRNALRQTGISLPKTKINIRTRIKQIHEKLKIILIKEKRIPFSEFVKNDKKEKIDHFSPLLHLENQQKIWMEQKGAFEEIHIWFKKTYFKHNPHPFQELIDEKEKNE